jgi:2-dehydropantoate 2-reductase
MRWLMLGVGAIGGYVGGSLALAGEEVTFLDRPQFAQVLQQNGLTLRIGEQLHHLKQLNVVSSLAEALQTGQYDVAVLAVKSYDTDGVAEMLTPYVADLPPVLSLQNGVENELRLTQVLGPGKVLRGTVTSAIGRKPGEIVLERLRGMGVANEHELAPALVSAMSRAGLNAHLFQNGPAMKWSKMLTNLLANASAALLNWSAAQVFANPQVYRLEMAQLGEALAVMRALRLPVLNLPGTPVRALAMAASLPTGLSQPLLQRALGRGRGGKMPSFHIDLHSGSGKSEVIYLNGAVARLGQAVGVPAPVNERLTELLMAVTTAQLPIDTFENRPQALWEAVYERA